MRNVAVGANERVAELHRKVQCNGFDSAHFLRSLFRFELARVVRDGTTECHDSVLNCHSDLFISKCRLPVELGEYVAPELLIGSHLSLRMDMEGI
jgi:hypothetical protein